MNPSICPQEFRVNERGNLVPHLGVVLDLVVRFIKNPGKPTIVVAIDLMVFVFHVKVAQDLGSTCIGCNDERLSARETFPLIKIHCFRHIGRNRAIVLSELLHAVNLDRE